MNMFIFWFSIHWNLFPMVRFSASQHWFRLWHGASQAPCHYLNQCWPRCPTPYGITETQWVNTLRPRQNGRHFPDDIFKWIFLNENVWISINISLKFVPRGPINSIPTLVQVMAWRRPGDKPLSERMMVRLPTHICVTRPQWVNQTLDWWVNWKTSPLAWRHCYECVDLQLALKIPTAAEAKLFLSMGMNKW